MSEPKKLSQIIEQFATETLLQENLEEILETIEGVGKVKVLIKLKSTKLISKDWCFSSCIGDI